MRRLLRPISVTVLAIALGTAQVAAQEDAPAPLRVPPPAVAGD